MKILRKKLPSPSNPKSLINNVVRASRKDDHDHDDDENPASTSSTPVLFEEGEYLPPPGPQSMIRLPSSRGRRGRGGGDDGSGSASTSRGSASQAPHCNTAVHTFSFSDEEVEVADPSARRRDDDDGDDKNGGGGPEVEERGGKGSGDDGDDDEEARAYGAPVTKSSKTLPSSNRRRSKMLARMAGKRRDPSSSLPESAGAEDEVPRGGSGDGSSIRQKSGKKGGTEIGGPSRCDDTKVSTLSSNSHTTEDPSRRSSSAVSASASGSGSRSRSRGRRVPLVSMDTGDVSMVRPSLTVSQRKKWLAGGGDIPAPKVAVEGKEAALDDNDRATTAAIPFRPTTSQSIGEPSYQRPSCPTQNLRVDEIDSRSSSSSDSGSSFSPPPAPPPRDRDDDDDNSERAVLVKDKYTESARYIFEDDGEYDDETLGDTVATGISSRHVLGDDGTFVTTSVVAGCDDGTFVTTTTTTSVAVESRAERSKETDDDDDRRSEGTSSVDTDLLSRINLDDDQLMSGSQSPGTLRITPEGLKRHERKQLRNLYDSCGGDAGGGGNEVAESIVSGASMKSGMSGYEEWKKRKELTKMALELSVEEDLDESRLRRRRERKAGGGRESAKSGTSKSGASKSFIDEEDAKEIAEASVDETSRADEEGAGGGRTLSLSDVDTLEDYSALDSLLSGHPDRGSVAMGSIIGSAISPNASGSLDAATAGNRRSRRGSSVSPEKKKKGGNSLTAKFQKTIQTVGSNVSSAASSIKHEATSRRESAAQQHRRLGSGVTNFSVVPFATMGDDSVSDLMKSGIAKTSSSSAEKDGGKGSGSGTGRDVIHTCAQKLLGTKSKAITGSGAGNGGKGDAAPTAEDLLEAERLKHVQERIEKRTAEKKEKRRIEEMKARELARQRRREIEARKERGGRNGGGGLRRVDDDDEDHPDQDDDREDDRTPLTKNSRERKTTTTRTGEDRRSAYSKERRIDCVLVETSAMTLEEEGRRNDADEDDADGSDGGGGQGVEVVDTTGLVDSLPCCSSPSRFSPPRSSSSNKSVGSDEVTAKRGSSSNLHRRRSGGGSVGGGGGTSSSSAGNDARAAVVAAKCAICRVGERTHLATPCMHFSFCTECVEKMRSRLITNCPVCDSPDVVFNKVYF